MTDTTVTLPCSTNTRGPKVNFARYEGGQLTIFPAHTTELEYYAISHVWGEVEWLEIPGAQGTKKVSRDKAHFIEHELGPLVGNTAFWMDTLTVDQRDEDEKIATVQAIPAIFRDAILTIAVRENDGFYDCCMEVVRDCFGWEDCYVAIDSHNMDAHFDHVRHESYLKRLWTLQECLLSRSIKFVAPRNNIPRLKEETVHSDWLEHETHGRNMMDSLFSLAVTFFNEQHDKDCDVDRFIKAYLSSGSVSKHESATIIRSSQESIHTGSFLRTNLSSNRVATYPRDYIFATMPQFPWYQYPPNAPNMTFPEIFRDLHDKAAMSGHAFVSRFTASMTNVAATVNPAIAWQPSESLPDPTCLGDFLKLIGGRTRSRQSSTSPDIHLTTVVKVMELPLELSYANSILKAIEATIRFDPSTWSGSHVSGELSKYGSDPRRDWRLTRVDALACGWVHTGAPYEGRMLELHDETIVVTGPGLEYLEVSPAPLATARTSRSTNTPRTTASLGDSVDDDEWEDCSDDDDDDHHHHDGISLFQQSRMILALMWTALDEIHVDPRQREAWDYFNSGMRLTWNPPLLRTMSLLAAMVACGIPLSAESWVNLHFIPVFLIFNDRTLLGLLARHARINDKSKAREMLSVGNHLPGQDGYGTDLVLADSINKTPVGHIPPFFSVNVDNDVFVERAGSLYFGFVKAFPDEKIATSVVQLAEVRVIAHERVRDTAS